MAASVSTEIYLATTLYMDADLLPQFVRYYRNLGVDHILTLINSWAPPGARELALDHGCTVVPVDNYSPAFGHIPTDSEARELQARVSHPRAPVIFADLDEFYEYPDDIHALAEKIAYREIDAVRGRFLDRVTVDGSIPRTPPSPDIWTEFPVGCNLTAAVPKVDVNKIMLTYATAPISGGHHGMHRPQKYHPNWGTAHHFKWRGTVFEKTKAMHASYIANGMRQSIKIGRLLDWLGDPPRINLDDPQLAVCRPLPPAAARAAAG